MNEIPNAIGTTGDEDPLDRVAHEIAVADEVPWSSPAPGRRRVGA